MPIPIYLWLANIGQATNWSGSIQQWFVSKSNLIIENIMLQHRQNHLKGGSFYLYTYTLLLIALLLLLHQWQPSSTSLSVIRPAANPYYALICLLFSPPSVSFTSLTDWISHCPRCTTTVSHCPVPGSYHRRRVYSPCTGTSADQISCSRTWQTEERRGRCRSLFRAKLNKTPLTCLSPSTVINTLDVNPAPLGLSITAPHVTSLRASVAGV